VVASISLTLLVGAALPGSSMPGSSLLGPSRQDGQAEIQPIPIEPVASATGTVTEAASLVPVAPPSPQPPTIAQALDSGMLIVISKASQRMRVFKDGETLLTSPVSTGRRGHVTPSGVFPIIEKRRYHRSNLYSNAPMPFMQRLTMDGIAIHAGHLPGYPASHGCIRLPYGIARSLFNVTRARDTIVVIVNAAMQSEDQARRLALALEHPPSQDAAVPEPALASVPEPVRTQAAFADAGPGTGPGTGPGIGTGTGPRQTIQLAAALSPEEAEAHWQSVLSREPGLGGFDKAVIPAIVGSRRYYRLRVSGPNAFAWCSRLKGEGLDCFKVR